MTQPSGSSSDIDTIKQLLFGAELARIEQAGATDRQAAQTRAADLEQRLERASSELERRVGQRLEELSQRVASQLEELSRKQQAHADRVTQVLDQVMAELAKRSDSLTAETRAGLEELRAKTADLERKKLNVAEFGSSLATLGQRFQAGGDSSS